MLILPAIDMISGQAVRLVKGDFEQQTSYGDPFEVITHYLHAGATHVHLVDLDAAKNGQTSSQTIDFVEKVIKDTPLQVELGGGIRTERDVERWLQTGVWRCVIGTRAAEDPDFAASLFHTYRESIIVGIDSREGMVATRGWLENSSWKAEEFAKALFQMGFRECIFTDISRDGTLQGANMDLSIQLSAASGLKVVVSGGVSDESDVMAAKSLEDQGISGIIIGKALFSGKIDLKSALALVSGGEA